MARRLGITRRRLVDIGVAARSGLLLGLSVEMIEPARVVFGDEQPRRLARALGHPQQASKVLLLDTRLSPQVAADLRGALEAAQERGGQATGGHLARMSIHEVASHRDGSRYRHPIGHAGGQRVGRLEREVAFGDDHEIEELKARLRLSAFAVEPIGRQEGTGGQGFTEALLGQRRGEAHHQQRSAPSSGTHDGRPELTP